MTMENKLDRIKGPNDIKQFSPEELPALAKEIRRFLVRHIAKTGGHLASNLGVVELTMALHYCFDVTQDQIVWDVGHQAYVHKILTGRKDGFKQLRQLDGLSGFPKPCESSTDIFATGHSSTSISAALGLAVARDLKKEDHEVMAVIGDGSLTGGLAYEGLNNAGQKNTRLFVILNDNGMSISGNVGAMSGHLQDLRTATFYRHAKEEIHAALEKMPVVGRSIEHGLERVKNSVKYLFVPGIMFEEMGFHYLGPVDGHKIEELIDYIEKMKQLSGPVLLHVKTVKGKGYPYAEQDPAKFHGVGPFEVKTGQTQPMKESYSSVFGKTLVESAKKNKSIVAITAAMTGGTGLTEFSRAFPSRFFDVGIAEQHAVTFAAGMAKEGLRPVFAVYSTFLQRAYDEILEDVCFQDLPVVFALDRAGLVGADGETHQGIFDIAYLSHMPNITLMAPRSGAELKAMLHTALSYAHPVAIRYPKSAVEENWEQPISLPWGKAEQLSDGTDVTIVSVGAMFEIAKEVQALLAKENIQAALWNARFLHPIDPALIEACAKMPLVVTIEDHVRTGGFGALLEQALEGTKGEVLRFALPDRFIEQGTRAELFARYHLTAQDIYAQVLARKEEGHDR